MSTDPAEATPTKVPEPDRVSPPEPNSSVWASDAIIADFLDRLSELSLYDWNSIRLRGKKTKVYTDAIVDVEHFLSLYPSRRPIWEESRAKAISIVNSAPLGTLAFVHHGILHDRRAFADAAADAVGALVILLPWGSSFERLYGPFRQVIPHNYLRSGQIAPAITQLSPPSFAVPGGTSTSSPNQTSIAPTSRPVHFGKALGFFGGEAAVVLIWLFVGVQFAVQMGPGGLIIGGMPAAAAFFALKVSRGPIASIDIMRYQRRLDQLRRTDRSTFEFVERWRDITAAVGWILVLAELFLLVGLWVTATR